MDKENLSYIEKLVRQRERDEAELQNAEALEASEKMPHPDYVEDLSTNLHSSDEGEEKDEMLKFYLASTP